MRGLRQHRRRAGTADGSGVVPVLAPRYRTPLALALALRCGPAAPSTGRWRRRGSSSHPMPQPHFSLRLSRLSCVAGRPDSRARMGIETDLIACD